MNIKKVLAVCVVALAPALAMATPMKITSMPTDDTQDPGALLRHNVFHAATLPGGVGGDVLAWFDLDTSFNSTWDPATGDLILNVRIFQDSAHTILLGTGTGLGSLDFGVGNNASIGFIDWTFAGAGVGILGPDLTMEFINHSYPGDSAGNIPNSYVGNTVTLWGADGMHDGNGLFNGASLGVDMVFIMPEPGMLLLMAMGLLAIGVSARRR